MQASDISLEKARDTLARSERLRATVTSELDQREAAAKTAHNAGGRDRRKALLAELTAQSETILADLLDAASDELRSLLILCHQKNAMRERLQADSISAIHEAADLDRQNAKVYEPPAPKPEDYQPKCEPRQQPFVDHGGTCSDPSCRGALCVVCDGAKTVVQCDRCGADVAGHPLLQPA